MIVSIQAEPPKRENNPPLCVACRDQMTFIITISDPLLKRVRLFECPKCRNTAFLQES
jgi:hypothetical protein